MPPITIPERGFLQTVGLDEEILVEFQYNPTQLSDKRALTYATLSAPGQLMPGRQYTQGGDRTLSFSVHIDGLFVPADNELTSAGSRRRTGLGAGGGGRAPIQRDETGSIEPELNKYRAFLYPRVQGPLNWAGAGRSFVPFYEANEPQFASPPLCLFGMGRDRVVNCIVIEIDITETLFNRSLRPLRADVAVTLVEYVPYDRITT
jgi:hypothetical protein